MLARFTLVALAAALGLSTLATAEDKFTVRAEDDTRLIVGSSSPNQGPYALGSQALDSNTTITVILNQSTRKETKRECQVYRSKKEDGKIVRTKNKQGAIDFKRGVEFVFGSSHGTNGGSYLNRCGDPDETGVLLVCGETGNEDAKPVRATCEPWK